MPLVSMRQLLDEAAKGGYGVGAFHVNNMEQIQASWKRRAKQSRRLLSRPAAGRAATHIVQASRGARSYSQDKFLYHLMLAATELYPEIPTVVLGGIEDGHGAGGTGLEHVTDPDQAVEFVDKTGVDALAIAIGTSHGAYKFNKKPDGSVLKMGVLIQIHKHLPETHLLMHGLFQRAETVVGHHQSVRWQIETNVGRCP